MVYVANKYGRKNPFGELGTLQEAVNSLFEGYPNSGPRYPAVDLHGNADATTVTVDLPGVKPEDVSLTVKEHVLYIEGERKGDELGESETRYHQERGFGKFSRAIRLPHDVESEKVKARFDKGVLHISLPRAEASKPKQITIEQGE